MKNLELLINLFLQILKYLVYMTVLRGMGSPLSKKKGPWGQKDCVPSLFKQEITS